MVVYNVSQQISAHTFKCSRQTLSCKLSPIVCSTVVPLRMKSISWIRQSSFFWHFFKTENCFRSSGLKFRGNPSHVHQRRWLLCSSNYSLMEMTSSVANIICIAQITFNFWTRDYRLYWIADVVAKSFELFSDLWKVVWPERCFPPSSGILPVASEIPIKWYCSIYFVSLVEKSAVPFVQKRLPKIPFNW